VRSDKRPSVTKQLANLERERKKAGQGPTKKRAPQPAKEIARSDDLENTTTEERIIARSGIK